MTGSPSQAAIRSVVDAFTSDLAAIVRASALNAVTIALGSPAGPRSRATTSKPNGTLRSAAPVARGQGKRAKRTPEDVAKMGEAVVAYIAKHPGQSVEQIGKAIGTTTKELALPIIKMAAAKKLKTTGRRRGTRYFAR